jgi:methylglutaconyl-CoA hydratase
VSTSSPSSPLDAGRSSYSIASGVATLSFTHPKGNSLPGALLRRIAEQFDELTVNADVRVIVLRSEGTGPFCAGASFDELRAIQNEDEGKEFFSGFARVILAMKRCGKFIVARVQGKAVGGGVGLVAASDYAIAHVNAQVRLSELAIGIGPFVVGPVIERRIGSGRFAALAIDFDWRDAPWAHAAGLYAKVVESTSVLDDATDSLLERLAASNPAAMAEMKRTFWEGTDAWETLLFERAATSGRLILSEHSRRAIAAFAK